MKKIIATMLFVAFGIAVSAQGDYKGFVLNASTGYNSYDASSGVSLFSSGERLSSVSGAAITAGYRNGAMMYGLRAGFTTFTTVHGRVEELVNPWEFSLMMRRYLPLGERFELYTGLSVGFGLVFNSFDYLGTNYSYTRYGITEDFELGLDYRISGATSVGLRAAVSPFSGLFDKGTKLPDGLSKNGNTSLNAFSVSLQYSIDF